MPGARISSWRPGLVALALCGAAAPASAQSCGQEIDRLARQYDLPTGAPRAGSSEAPAAPSATPVPGDGATATERRAQSSGVLSPPDTAAPTVIRPPRSGGEREAVPPDADATVATHGEGGQLPAAERQRMAALLASAQAAARNGNEQQCLEHLREAQSIPGVPGTK